MCHKVSQTANFATVEAYWNIGKSIIEKQDGNETARSGNADIVGADLNALHQVCQHAGFVYKIWTSVVLNISLVRN